MIRQLIFMIQQPTAGKTVIIGKEDRPNSPEDGTNHPHDRPHASLGRS